VPVRVRLRAVPKADGTVLMSRDDLELVILVGLQASGKTTFRQMRFDGTHVIVSKDLLRNNRRPQSRSDAPD
jgi:hypothetical protein